MPLGGLVPMWLMQLGEVVFGGVGSGLYGMLVFAIIAVFVAGLMVGRTPEYLGKKIEAFEMKMASLVILIPPMLVLVGTALAVSTDAGRAGILNPGPTASARCSMPFRRRATTTAAPSPALTPKRRSTMSRLALAMLVGRYWLAIPTLAHGRLPGSQEAVPAGPGTLPTHTPLFVALLIGVVLLVGALTFFPALALGPIVEHLAIAW